MTPAQMYLPQVLCLIGLPYLTALLVLITRVADLLQNKRPLAFYEEFDGRDAPLSVLRSTRQLANQFEFPVLFYTLVSIAIAVPLERPILAGLAWGYVALRWAHALSHIFFNRLYIRTPIFMAGNVVLLVMWAYLAVFVVG